MALDLCVCSYKDYLYLPIGSDTIYIYIYIYSKERKSRGSGARTIGQLMEVKEEIPCIGRLEIEKGFCVDWLPNDVNHVLDLFQP